MKTFSSIGVLLLFAYISVACSKKTKSDEHSRPAVGAAPVAMEAAVTDSGLSTVQVEQVFANPDLMVIDVEDVLTNHGAGKVKAAVLQATSADVSPADPSDSRQGEDLKTIVSSSAATTPPAGMAEIDDAVRSESQANSKPKRIVAASVDEKVVLKRNDGEFDFATMCTRHQSRPDYIARCDGWDIEGIMRVDEVTSFNRVLSFSIGAEKEILSFRSEDDETLNKLQVDDLVKVQGRVRLIRNVPYVNLFNFEVIPRALSADENRAWQAVRLAHICSRDYGKDDTVDSEKGKLKIVHAAIDRENPSTGIVTVQVDRDKRLRCALENNEVKIAQIGSAEKGWSSAPKHQGYELDLVNGSSYSCRTEFFKVGEAGGGRMQQRYSVDIRPKLNEMRISLDQRLGNDTDWDELRRTQTYKISSIGANLVKGQNPKGIEANFDPVSRQLRLTRDDYTTVGDCYKTISW